MFACFDDAVSLEIRMGIHRVRAEIVRMMQTVRLRHELASMDRDEARAEAELSWFRAELERLESNYQALAKVYARRRVAIHEQLSSSHGDAGFVVEAGK